MADARGTRNFGRKALVAVACGLCCGAVMLLAAGGLSAVAGIVAGSAPIVVVGLVILAVAVWGLVLRRRRARVASSDRG